MEVDVDRLDFSGRHKRSGKLNHLAERVLRARSRYAFERAELTGAET